MREGTPERTGDETAGPFVAGTPAGGQYRCAVCGYGIAVRVELPLCPMCGARDWEPVPWAPFGRAGGEDRGPRRPSPPAPL